ncbi:MAG: hypothetical protein ACPGXY_06170 [Alphaproteobacteria bacterium]
MMGVQYYALKGIFALAICVFALCDMSLASEHNSNVGSGDDKDAASAPGKVVYRLPGGIWVVHSKRIEAMELIRPEDGHYFCTINLASYNNSNVYSGDDKGAASASGTVTSRVPSLQYLALEKLSEMPESKRQELGVSYDKNSLICGGTMLNLRNTIHDEILSRIKDFELSKEGRTAEEIYKTKYFYGDSILSMSLPVNKDNIFKFIKLQAFVSPQLRRSLKLYLFLAENDVLEYLPDLKRQAYLRCLCVEEYTDEAHDKTVIEMTPEVRYISPLIKSSRIKGLVLRKLYCEVFPISLSNNPYLRALFITDTNLSQGDYLGSFFKSTLSKNIKYLNLSDCKLPNNFGEILSGMTQLCNLHLLGSLRGHQRVEGVLKSIPKTISILKLERNDFLAVPDLPSLPLLEYLSLKENPIQRFPPSVNGLLYSSGQGQYETIDVLLMPPFQDVKLDPQVQKTLEEFLRSQ